MRGCHDNALARRQQSGSQSLLLDDVDMATKKLLEVLLQPYEIEWVIDLSTMGS